jgi:hypothetical protein
MKTIVPQNSPVVLPLRIGLKRLLLAHPTFPAVQLPRGLPLTGNPDLSPAFQLLILQRGHGHGGIND